MAGLAGRSGRDRTKRISLTVCGVLAVAIAVLGRIEPAVFDRARATLSDIAEPALAKLQEPLYAIERLSESAATLFTVYRDNIELRKENAQLRKWQSVALSLEDKVRQFERLLNAVPDPDLHKIAARVIGQSSRPFIKTMILNAGSIAGVRKGQAVIDERGLLGRIFVAGERTSWVLLLTDPDSRVPVVVEPTHRRAILVGDNTLTPHLELDIGEPIAPGERVLSTGDGGLLPPDLPIGSILRDGDKWRVSLFAAGPMSDYVHVVDYDAPLPPVADATPAVPLRAEAAHGPQKPIVAAGLALPPPVSAPTPIPAAGRPKSDTAPLAPIVEKVR